MKKIKLMLLTATLAVCSNLLYAQEKSDSLKVYGNCGMCKATIEGSLKKKDGVLSKSWNKETKVLFVTYDASKITVQKIGEKVAAAGYDNQYATAPDEAYKKLHSCCHYERPRLSK